MSLVPYLVTALSQRDIDTPEGTNTFANVSVTLLNESGVAVTLYDDDNSSNPQTIKQTNAQGYVVVYVQPGVYSVVIDSQAPVPVTVGTSGRLKVETLTNDYTIQANDHEKLFLCEHSAPITVTVPVGLPTSTEVYFKQKSASQLTFAGQNGGLPNNTLTLESPTGFSPYTLNSKVGIFIEDANTASLSGDLG